MKLLYCPGQAPMGASISNTKIEGGRLHGEPRKVQNCQNWGWAPARDNTVVIMGLQQMYLVY